MNPNELEPEKPYSFAVKGSVLLMSLLLVLALVAVSWANDLWTAISIGKATCAITLLTIGGIYLYTRWRWMNTRRRK